MRSWCFMRMDEAPVALLNWCWSAVNTHMQDFRCHMACRQMTCWGSEMGTRTVVGQGMLTGIQRIQGSEHQEAWTNGYCILKRIWREKSLYFGSSMTEVFSQWSRWQETIMRLYDGLASSKQQNIIWTNDDQVSWGQIATPPLLVFGKYYSSPKAIWCSLHTKTHLCTHRY